MTPPVKDYRPIGQRIAVAQGVPWGVFDQLIAHESNWNNSARSSVGAMGFGQLMPGTAQGLGVDPNNPIQNLQGSAKYFRQMMDEFGGDVKLALAAYNAGPAAVKHYGGIPPFAETQAYVAKILAAAAGGGGKGGGGKAGQGQAGLPDPATGGYPDVPTISSEYGQKGQIIPGLQSLAGLLKFAGPSDSTASILDRLGGTAGKAARAGQAPIPLPGGADSPVQQQQPLSGAEPIQFPPMLSVEGQLQGQVPMSFGGDIRQQYPNLQVASTADWHHINPALLKAVDAAAKSYGVVAVINSGYRSSDYNKKIGGAQDSRHQKGLALDAYINGHPIGEVIPPEFWAKKGIRSGNVPGFFNGKPDPMHLDMAGIPLKARKEQK